MEFIPTHISGLLVLQPKLFEDTRGYFFESYNEREFKGQGIDLRFLQDNQSSSHYGVIRGLHYQMAPFAQTKLVRVLQGKILDVALDIRKGSPTYGQTYCVELSADNKKQLFIPKGFAHGFAVLSERAEVLYKCDTFYNKESDAGILYDDPALGIDWQVPSGKMIISDKDKQLPVLADCRNNFVFGE